MGNKQGKYNNVKTWSLIVKTMIFEDLAGFVRERKRFQQIITNDSKIHQKGIQQNNERINRNLAVKIKKIRSMERRIVENTY